MHPKTLEVLDANLKRGLKLTDWPARILSGVHHFHVSKGVGLAADSIARSELEYSDLSGEAFYAPSGSKPPADELVLTVEHDDGTIVLPIYCDGSDVTICAVGCVPGAPELSRVFPIVMYQAGGNQIFPVEPSALTDSITKQYAATFNASMKMGLAVSVMFMFSLMNEPTRVEKVEASNQENSRPHRNRVKKLTGKAALAWTNVRWTVGKAMAAKRRANDPEWVGRPLHWSRAHWRACDANDPRAEWIERKSVGKWGWYKWIKDCYKGHPDFGIKLQRHEPAMPGEKRPGAVRPTSVVDQTRFLAMGAQQRAALVASGFAPSSTIH